MHSHEAMTTFNFLRDLGLDMKGTTKYGEKTKSHIKIQKNF